MAKQKSVTVKTRIEHWNTGKSGLRLVTRELDGKFYDNVNLGKLLG
jgi:hypothetical protein